MADTRIEWTDKVWNPLVGCSRVSEGCRHCYAERQAYRNAAMGNKHYEAVTSPVLTRAGAAWNGKVVLVESTLDLPLKWKKPRRIFVNSMSDLFHEKVTADWLQQIFAVMVRTPQHTYQILTKRPERMLDIMGDYKLWEWLSRHYRGQQPMLNWPLPNVWLGVSVEDQATANERIPLLLQTPAAVRWVSYEPALGPVDFGCWVPGGMPFKGQHGVLGRDLDWIVVGGESGPGARPFNLDWAQRTIDQGREAGVPVFVKQVGSKPTTDQRTRPAEEEAWRTHMIRDRKGGDITEWPERLRVREFPKGAP